MNRQLIRQIPTATRRLDRIHVAYHVRDRHVRRRQLFHVPMLAAEPRDRRGVAFLRDPLAAGTAERPVGVVVNLASFNHWDLRVHECRESAENARLRLSAQPEQDEMVPRENCVDDLRHHRVVVPMHAYEQGLAALHFAEQVLPQLLPYGPVGDALLRPLAASQLAQRFRHLAHVSPIPIASYKSNFIRCDSPAKSLFAPIIGEMKPACRASGIRPQSLGSMEVQFRPCPFPAALFRTRCRWTIWGKSVVMRLNRKLRRRSSSRISSNACFSSNASGRSAAIR